MQVIDWDYPFLLIVYQGVHTRVSTLQCAAQFHSSPTIKLKFQKDRHSHTFFVSTVPWWQSAERKFAYILWLKPSSEFKLTMNQDRIAWSHSLSHFFPEMMQIKHVSSFQSFQISGMQPENLQCLIFVSRTSCRKWSHTIPLGVLWCYKIQFTISGL